MNFLVNLVAFLENLQDYFVFVVSQFLYIPWNYAHKQAAIRASLQSGSSCTPSIPLAAAENLESHLTDYLKGQVRVVTRITEGCMTCYCLQIFFSQSDPMFVCVIQISSYFTDKLLGIVRDTTLHMKEINRSENEQHIYSGPPHLASNVNKGDAALEFIKHVCAVLALDQNVQHDVLVMAVHIYLSPLSFISDSYTVHSTQYI